MKSKECKPLLPKQHPMLSTCDLSEKCLKQKRNEIKFSAKWDSFELQNDVYYI